MTLLAILARHRNIFECIITFSCCLWVWYGMVGYQLIWVWHGMVGTQWVLHLFKPQSFLPIPRIAFEPQMTEEVDVLT